jgi:carbamoyl-phosphate synthase small subunit
MKAFLILADGTVFPGERFGSPREVICEMVFNTGLTGYLELLTDASYAGQGIVMTSPIIGNYGVFTEHGESGRPWASAMVIRDLTHIVRDERDAEDLEDYLIRYNLPGIRGVDTRTLTLRLREHGTMNGMITESQEYCLEECLPRIRAYVNASPVARVSRKEVKSYPAGASGRPHRGIGQARPAEALAEAPYTIDPAVKCRHKVAMLDFGLKQNIVWNLCRRGCEVTVYPWDTPAEILLSRQPDGIALSNGPGDPVDCTRILPNIRAIFDSGKPTIAICLGHQLMALATGARTRRLKYGHRGINHPVKDLAADRVYITSQNHGYEVIAESIDPNLAQVSHLHVNDGSVEGIRYASRPIISVQYHPEGAPGPHDSEYLFDEFISLMASGKGKS